MSSGICRSLIQQKAKTCQQARGQGAVDNTPSLHKPQRPAQPQPPKEPANPPTTRSQSQKEKSPQKLDLHIAAPITHKFIKTKYDYWLVGPNALP